MGESKLNFADDLFRTIYNDSPIGIELYDSNGKLIDLNKSCMELFGVSSKDDIKGFNLLNDPNIPTEHLTKLKRRETVNFESVFDFELVKDKNLYRTNKSGKIYLDVLITPLYAREDKSISNYLVQIREITDQKIAERKLIDLNEELEHRIEERTEKLRKSEGKYRLLAENLNDIITVVNDKGQVEYINEEAHTKVMGYSHNDLMYQSVFDLIHPDDKEKIIQAFKKVFKEGEGFTEAKIIECNSKAFQISGYNSKEECLRTPVVDLYYNPSDRERFIELHDRGGVVKDFEVEFKRKDGSIFWCSITSIAQKMGDQTTYINSFQDITDRKLAEIKIQQSEAELAAIYNYTPIAILLVDNERRIRKINKFALKFTDRKEEEVFGIHGGEALRCLYSIKDPRGCGFSEDCQDCTIRNTVLDTFKTKIPHINIEATLYLLPGGDIDNVHLLISTVPLKFDGEDLVLISLIDITDRMHAEQNLIESEEKYKNLSLESELILDNTPAVIFYKDLENNYIQVNKYLADSMNASKDDLKGKNMLELFPKEDAQAYWDDDLEVAKSGKPKLNIVEPYETGEGKRWVSTSKIPIFDSNKNVIGIIGMAADITDRMKAEQELKESEERYREIFENSPVALFEQDFSELKSYLINLKASGVIDFEKYLDENPEEIINFSFMINLVEVNKKALELYKAQNKDDFIVRKHQIEKKNFQDIPPEVLLANKREIRSLIKGDTTFESEVVIKTFTGEKIYVYMKTVIIPGYENSWSKVIVSLLDITDRIIAEQKLKESEEKFRTIAEQSTLGVIIQQEGLIKFVSPAVSNILEYPIEEINNWTAEDTLKIIHVDDLEQIIEKSIARNEDDYATIISYECRITTKNGNLKWIEVMSKPIKFLDKRAVLISMIDITIKKEVEEELKEVSNLKSELLSRTSHELKTPLVSIKGYVDLLLQVHYDHLDFYTISMLGEIRQGCVRLESLIKDLLETSKLDSGSIELKKYKEDLSFLIKFCMKDLQGLANIRKHEVLIDIDDNMITMFEKERIYEVIVNLLSNAIKYTPPQGIIKLGSKIENNQYIISIEDNGIGFSEEERNKIFKKFGKIERYGKGLDVVSEGSGLGLYISKGIIELHGGQIWAESKGQDKGSTFYFSLPIMVD